MKRFKDDLILILKDDPLGLLASKSQTSDIKSSDERIHESFEEINKFFQTNGRAPEKTRNIEERKLFSRLEGFKAQPDKVQLLKSRDKFNLLPILITDAVEVRKEVSSLDDVLKNDFLGLLDNDNEANEILTLRNVPKKQTMPDQIAKRSPCKDFLKFEHLFIEMHQDLKSKKKITEPFNSEKQIAPGEFFILSGMLLMVGNVGQWEKKGFGNVNAKTYCVFENGTESNMLLRSLAAALWKDQNSRRVIDPLQIRLFDAASSISEEDRAFGYIYILKSKSSFKELSSIKDLYKVGFSSNPPKMRTRDASSDPTFLNSPVELVSEFKCYNLNPQKLELILHRFFGNSCLDIELTDESGLKYRPREWFVAPFEVIEQAIAFILNGDILEFRYDPERKQIVRK